MRLGHMLEMGMRTRIMPAERRDDALTEGSRWPRSDQLSSHLTALELHFPFSPMLIAIL